MREPMTVVDFPDQLRNDIFYCQKALKDHIKIHQFCAVQNAIKPTKRYGQVILKIEKEIEGIAMDQQRVVHKMKVHLSTIHQKLMDTSLLMASGTTSIDDYDNKIIRSYLDMHRPSMDGLQLQASGFVQSRATEKELIRNYDLLTDLQLFMRPTHVIERLPLSPMKPGGNRPSSQQNLVSESRLKFLAALKAVKPQQTPQSESESDGEGLASFLPEEEEEQQQQQVSMPLWSSTVVPPAAVAVPGPVAAKKGRGRPRKTIMDKLPGVGTGAKANSASAPSTRANSPEIVTMPWVDLPAEPEETNDYDQPRFLRIFGLYTKEMAKYLKNKRPERRRRTVQSTEKTDFHYGQLDVMVSPLKERPGLLGKKHKPMQQYLSPRTFKKRRTFYRSASSSPPTEPVLEHASA